MMPDEDEAITVDEMTAYIWRCAFCRRSGDLEMDEALAFESGWNHDCKPSSSGSGS